MTQMFVRMFRYPFDTDNASYYLANFASGVVTTPAVKERLLRQRQSVGNRLHEAAFDTIRRCKATQKLL